MTVTGSVTWTRVTEDGMSTRSIGPWGPETIAMLTGGLAAGGATFAFMAGMGFSLNMLSLLLARRNSRDDPTVVWVWHNIKARDKMRRKSASNVLGTAAAAASVAAAAAAGQCFCGAAGQPLGPVNLVIKRHSYTKTSVCKNAKHHERNVEGKYYIRTYM